MHTCNPSTGGRDRGITRTSWLVSLAKSVRKTKWISDWGRHSRLLSYAQAHMCTHECMYSQTHIHTHEHVHANILLPPTHKSALLNSMARQPHRRWAWQAAVKAKQNIPRRDRTGKCSHPSVLPKNYCLSKNLQEVNMEAYTFRLLTAVTHEWRKRKVRSWGGSWKMSGDWLSDSERV